MTIQGLAISGKESRRGVRGLQAAPDRRRLRLTTARRQALEIQPLVPDIVRLMAVKFRSHRRHYTIGGH